MYQSDWILRQIEMFSTILKRLASMLREQRPDEALELAAEGIGEVLDTDPALADSLTGEGLVSLLSAGGSIDTMRAHVLGELLAARAEAHDQLGESNAAEYERERARIVLEALAPEVEGEQAEAVAELLASISRS